MFKLESYITPIILSYVDKYVKNARAERSQVSLWGGDVVFSNLDLRLDVLEQELGLPFTFVSGHIHELHINVPWTRLNTEPLSITINTIECVLRLPDSKSKASPESSEASFRSSQDQQRSKKASRRLQQQDTPPGYVQSLINKIISNVKIECNNLILKYVEDDIVLSLNTRWLCLTSANALWEPAFVDLSLPDLVLRKLLQVKDMTICLDRRDISGRINEYQEPFLYRCSLNVHAAWLYDSLTNKIPRVTRYDIRCSKMDFSLTDTQLPMFMRIANLLLSLYYGQLTPQESSSSNNKNDHSADDFSITIPSSNEDHEDPSMSDHDSSWSGWAWTVGSTVGSALLPIYWEDEDEDQDTLAEEAGKKHFQLWKDKVFHLGLYVDQASLVIKLTENKAKSNVHPSNRLSFSPFLKLELRGIFQDIKSIGVHTVNVRNGISGMSLIPLGDCICGQKDTLESDADQDDIDDSSYLVIGDKSKRSFLRGSFFVDFGDEDGTCMERRCSYDDYNWERHMEQVSEESMLERTPAFALDLLYQLDLPSDFESDNLSVISDLENTCSWNEKFICRAVLGPASLRLCSGSLHRLATIYHFASKYDYPPYKMQQKAEENEADTVIADDNITIMEENAKKVRVYQITAINPSVIVYAADHPDSSFDIEAHLVRRAAAATPNHQAKAQEKTILFTNGLSLVMSLDCLDSKLIQPMYPNKVANLVTIHQPKQLSDNCYTSLDIKMVQLACRMAMSSKKQSITWLQPSNMRVKVKQLSFENPNSDSEAAAAELEVSLDIETLKLKSSRPQWLLLNYLVGTWMATLDNQIDQISEGLLHDAMMSKLAVLGFLIKGAHFGMTRTATSTTWQQSTVDLSICLGLPPHASHLSGGTVPILSTSSSSSNEASLSKETGLHFPASPGRAMNKRINTKEAMERKWLKCDFQLPNSPEFSQDIFSLCSVTMGDLHVNLDPKFNDWFLYLSSPQYNTVKPEEKQIPTVKKKSLPSCKGRKKASSSGKRSSCTKTTPKLAVKDEKKKRKSDFVEIIITQFLNQWLQVFNAILIQVQMEPITIFAPRKSLAAGGSQSRHKTVRHVKECLEVAKSSKIPLLCLVSPSISIENAVHKPMIGHFIEGRVPPFAIPENVWNLHRDNLPWTLKLTDFGLYMHSAQGVVEDILAPISTNCTFGLTGKESSIEKQGGKGVAVCVHADMTNFNVSISEEQLQFLIGLAEKSLHTLSILRPNFFNDNDETSSATPDYHPGASSSLSSGSALSEGQCYVVKMREMSTDHSSIINHGGQFKDNGNFSDVSSGKSEPFKLVSTDASKSNSSGLSLWVQWTLPLANVSLLAGNNGLKQRLTLTIEDYQSSFDWSPIYFQAKVKVLSAGIKHQVKSSSKRCWDQGPNQGLVLTFDCDEITNELETVKGGNWLELLSEERNLLQSMPLRKTCFSLVFTRAECRNLHRKWQELMQKSSSQHHDHFPNQQQSEYFDDRFISEVDLKLAPVDIIADTEALLPFIRMCSRPMHIKWPAPTQNCKIFRTPHRRQHRHHSLRGGNATQADSALGINVNNNTLPLVYLKAKSIRFFCPSHPGGGITGNSGDGGIEEDGQQIDMVLVNIESFSIAPQADNPISRILIKPDIYHLSGPVLEVPGSMVENRQYQIDIKELGMFTGQWNAILKQSRKNSRRPAELQVRSENPALEWNLQSQDDDKEKCAQPLILMPVIRKFDLQIVAAPAIVLPSSSPVPQLIAGHSLEINALTDIALTASLGQLQLCHRLLQELLMAADVLRISPASLASRGPILGRSFDSGIANCSTNTACQSQESSSSSALTSVAVKPASVTKEAIKDPVVPPFVPMEILLTARTISASFYSVEPTTTSAKIAADNSNNSSWRKLKRGSQMKSSLLQPDLKNDDGSDFRQRKFRHLSGHHYYADAAAAEKSDVGYEASEEEGSSSESSRSRRKERETCQQIFPLIYCSLVQPHLFLSCSPSSQKLEASVFDVSLSIPEPKHFITCPSGPGICLPTPQDFSRTLLQTRPGVPERLTGIPPALATLSLRDFLQKKFSLTLKLERPFKSNISLSIIHHVQKVHQRMLAALDLLKAQKILQAADQGDQSPTTPAAFKVFDTIHGSTSQMVLVVALENDDEHHREIQLGCYGCNFKVKTQQHQSEDLAKVTLTMGKIVAQTSNGQSRRQRRHQKFLGPWNFNFETEARWISSKRHKWQPRLTLQFHSETLTFFISQQNQETLQALLQSWQEYLVVSSDSPSQVNDNHHGNDEEIVKVEENLNLEQHYTDDLRAGAFHFVEKTEIEWAEAKPYQVIFTETLPAAMTWIYPKPRTLTRISVFPLPFVLADTETFEGDDNADISCTLEYWDHCLKSFRQYSSPFSLSETEMSHLDLPLVNADRKKLAVSNTWRIVIHSMDNDKEDTDKIKVKPQSLVSAVRVDSFYSPSLIPQLQASLRFDIVKLCLVNQPSAASILAMGGSQELMSLHVKNTIIGIDKWESKDSADENGFEINVRSKAQVELDFVDFMILSRHHLIPPCHFQLGMHILKQNGQWHWDSQINGKDLVVKFGHFAFHTLHNVTRLWNFISDPEEDQIWTSIVLQNNTVQYLKVGQADTDEALILSPNQELPYIWRSQKARLMLRCSLESAIQPGVWKASEPFSLRDDCSITAKIQHQGYLNTLIITMKKMNDGLTKVTLNGSISTANLLSDHLELRLVLRKNFSFLASNNSFFQLNQQQYENGEQKSNSKKEDLRSVILSNTVGNSHIIEAAYIQCIKVRLSGIGTPWSGDIPMVLNESSSNSNVLVRIPHKERKKNLTIWCRAIQENSRILYIFSPMYMARSLLPNPLLVLIGLESTSNEAAEQPCEMMLEGRDTPTALDTYHSPETKYQLSFKMDDKLPASEPFLLSWGIIEQVRDKDYQVPPIEQILSEIRQKYSKPHSSCWPFVEANSSGSQNLVDCLNVVNDFKPQTDVQVTFAQYHPLCNTICADINPWCLLVNQLGVTLLIKIPDCTVPVKNNSVIVPPNLTQSSTFQLGILLDDDENEEHFSRPLQLTDQEWHFQSLMHSTHHEGMVPLEGVCHNQILFKNKVCYFTIKTKNENGMRIINVLPTILMSNQASRTMSVAALVSSSSENCQSELKDEYLPQTISQGDTLALLFWQIIKQSSQSMFLRQHLALKTRDSTWSSLLTLPDNQNDDSSPDSKMSLSLPLPSPIDYNNRLQILTMHQREGQTHLVFQDDNQPQFSVHNCLPSTVSFSVAATTEAKTGGTLPRGSEIVQVLRDTSLLVASPTPIKSIVKAESQNSNFIIFLSCSQIAQQFNKKQDNQEWELIGQTKDCWSTGLPVMMISESTYCNIPGHGEASVRIERSNGTIFVFLAPFSDNEISAKDVRSRCILAENTEFSRCSSPNDVSRCSDDYSEGEKSFCTLQSPLSTLSNRTHYLSALENNDESYSLMSKFCLTFLLEKFSFILADDCIEAKNQLDEYFRITMDTFLLTVRPKLKKARQLESCLPNGVHMDTCLTIGNIQVDNQVYRSGQYDFPVVVKGHKTFENNPYLKSPLLDHSDRILKETKEGSVVRLDMDWEEDRQVGRQRLQLRTVVLKIQPLDVFIEDIFLYKVAEVMKSFVVLTSTKNEDKEESIKEVLSASYHLSQNLCLDRLEIAPLTILVSVHASAKAYVGLDSSPLTFGGYRREFIRTTDFALGQSIAKHYISGTLFRAGWVVGSLEMIGSPAGLTRAVGDGLRDFIALPYHGILNGPWAFLTGITHGSSSLVKHVSAGTLTSVTNFASSVSRNLDRLSFDSEHCQRNEMARRALPLGVGHGLANGLSGIGISILGAIGGLAHHPIKALVERGATPTGLMGGITRGLVGVVTKPLGGAAELVAQTGHGLLVGTGWTEKLQPREASLPQHICSSSSSGLKFAWKLNLTGPILCVAEATEESSLSPVTLVLTSEAVLIIGEDEDTAETVLPLSDIVCQSSTEDPTRLELVKPLKKSSVHFSSKTTSDHPDLDITNERIVQFVRETGGHFSSRTSTPSPADAEAAEKSNDDQRKLAFLANPIVKQAFEDHFQIAQGAIRQLGFPVFT